MVAESLDILKDKDAPLYTMGVAARLVGTTAQTLRLYEKHVRMKVLRSDSCLTGMGNLRRGLATRVGF